MSCSQTSQPHYNDRYNTLYSFKTTQINPYLQCSLSNQSIDAKFTSTHTEIKYLTSCPGNALQRRQGTVDLVVGRVVVVVVVVDDIIGNTIEIINMVRVRRGTVNR